MTRYNTATTPDRPEYEVRLKGEPAAPKVQRDVVEIDVHEEVGKHGRLALLLQNWNPDTREVRHSDADTFAPGTPIEVLLGYHSDLSSVFEGVVTAVTGHFPRDGAPVLQVEARSRSILLDYPPRSREFADASDADVAHAIAADYDLTAEADDGVSRPFVVSDRTTDWDFMCARSAVLGWVTYVRGQTLVHRAPAQSDHPINVQYGLNVIEVHVTQDIQGAITEAHGGGWDIDSLTSLKSEVGVSQTGIPAGPRADHATAVAEAHFPLRAHQITTASARAVDAVDAQAVGAQRRAAMAHYTGEGSVVGNPALRCDQWLTISGVGTRLEGPHYVSAARHRLSPRGYVTEFRVGRAPTLAPRSAGAGAGRQEGGLTVGIVKALDDPEKLNRVQVSFPWRADHGEGVWARLATLDAGDESGTMFVPNVGQEVLVGYLDADPSTPVVLGSLSNGKQKPASAIDPQRNEVRAIVSPGKHRLTFVDGDSAAVSVETAKGNTLVLSDKDDSITITHGESSNAITISAAGIELKAAQGDVTILSDTGAVKLDAQTIEGKAKGPSTFESSATFDLKASGPLGLKGALVNIN